MGVVKKIVKIVAGLMAIAVLILVGLGVQVWFFKPFNINAFFARTAMQVALESPQLLTSVHILEQVGIHGHNAKLDDASIAAGERVLDMLMESRDTLISYDDESLNEGDRLSKEIMLPLLDMVSEYVEFRFHSYPVNQLFGEQNGFPTFMESSHQVHSVRDAEDYITRLSLVGIKFDQVLEGLHRREELQILPPQFVVTKVIAEMQSFIDTPIDEGILLTALTKKMDEAELDAAEKERLADSARQAIADTVYPAYQSLIDYFVKLDEKVEGNHGVWSLPNGDKLYELALRVFTTTDYTPDYIHAFGLKEVDRLQAKILTVLAAEGIDTSGGFSKAVEALRENPNFYYEDTDAGRAQILKDYEAIIQEVSQGLASSFNSVPEGKVEVDRIPEFKEKTAAGAYYQPPAIDGSRPGVFFANLYDIKAQPKYGMRTLAYHEAIPGHHLQLAVQQAQKELPLFRRLVPFPAYAEGWALYAEQLAWEVGFQNDPYDNVGRLLSELFRGVRLVVDTGIHAKRWDRERAIAYMSQNTSLSDSEVVAEVERYFVMPGQACAYKVGMTKILELRDLAQTELGEQFDIKAFHDVVLTNGSLPLTILEKLVRQYIEETKAR
ncbi:MAG: DUF885 domain-containing protein [Pseudomonadales bacterium]|nr:DUF885 domain-containing protein [Pseudomonadales bacterium]